MANLIVMVGRFLLAIIFIVSGVTKLMNVAATEAMIQGAGLPAGLAIPAGLFELAAGLLLGIGLLTRIVALLLIGFVFFATLFFHNQFTDPEQSVHVLKNLAMVGGLLSVIGFAQLRSQFQATLVDREIDDVERASLERIRDAEVRAARAEGAAYGAPELGMPKLSRRE